MPLYLGQSQIGGVSVGSMTISSGNSGIDTTDATATATDILASKTAYVNGSKITGTIQSKAAATITPGTSNQTIASGQYLSGTQTIAGDANLIAANIISGKSIFGVNGSVVINKYYTGSSTPASSLGSNGDIYLKV